jgi:hypothetical protein
MVRCHEQNLPFLASHTIEGIEETGEGETRVHHLLSLFEQSVDIFQEDDASWRRISQQPVE